MKTKITAWLTICSICLTFLQVTDYAKDITGKEIAKEAPEVVEVSDLDSLSEAAAEEKWQEKRILVRSETEFDDMGAESIIKGYDDMFILDYKTKEAAKEAYLSLKKLPGLLVETDCCYSTVSAEEMTGPKENESILSANRENERNLSKRGEVLVAVLDTGYDYESYQDVRIVGGTDLTDTEDGLDANGHGTAMTNIILKYTPDHVKVMPIKVADEKGETSSLNLYLGIRYAIENGADIINISMSAYRSSGSEIFRQVIREAKKDEILVVVSAGNAGCDVSDFSPANEKEAVVVSAVSTDKTLAEYSNYGAYIDYCSYGTTEISGLNGTNTKQSGTSVAAALVSAAAAEQKNDCENGTWEELTELLNQKAKDLGMEGRDDFYGNGLLLPDSMETITKEGMKEDENEKISRLLSCDWKNISIEELNDYIGKAANLERRVFLNRLSDEERNILLSRNSLFSENVIYSENSFDENGNTKETLHMEGMLYDIVMSERFSDIYEIQAQKYHIFAYGSNTGTRSCIRLDTDANENDAVIYCWMKDRSSDHWNSGEYGITFVSGKSAYDFSKCTHKIENCDSADSGNPVVWRLKIRNVNISKPADTAVNYTADLWNNSTFQITGNTSSGMKEHYWYIYHYQVKPASDKDRQNAYGDGSYHGGFWDLGSASNKKCGSTVITTSVDIGTRDLYTTEEKCGITYRLPLVAHRNNAKQNRITDREASCTEKGSCHSETVYTCQTCDKSWTIKGTPQEMPQLAHNFAARMADDNGILNGKYWEECTRNCYGNDVNGVYWQRNVKYLQPIRYWEMNTDGSYDLSSVQIERGSDYYAPGEMVPKWSRTPSEEFLTGETEPFQAPAKASYHDVYIPRKQYTVKYDGNKAEGGTTAAQKVYCGQVFDLQENGFWRTGYTFLGWSREPDGSIINPKAVKNLTLSHNGAVTLYARWKQEIYEILFDHQGAEKEPGTLAVYEFYANGYYRNSAATQLFADNKITIPKKEIKDTSLIDGVRNQKFLGYYTSKNGSGYRMIESDGTMNANINHMGNYKYFTENSTVYAGWENMYAVQFHANLTEDDLKLLGKAEDGAYIESPVRCPFTRWKAKGESITIGFGEAKVENKKYAPFYRFLGWSLTPEISSRDEIILDEENCAYTFTADKDVTLYAQWDTSFIVAYMGNGSLEGMDFSEKAEHLLDDYCFAENHFTKTIRNPTIDIATGKSENDAKEPYMETVPYRFLGWSTEQEKEAVFQEAECMAGYDVISTADNTITFGAPDSAYQTYGVSQKLWEKRTPFVNLYAVWDQYPQIKAADLYLPLSDAKEGILTEDYLLSLAVAMDEELKSDKNPDGVMKRGIDASANTSFTILDYQAADFTEAEADMNLTITYKAEDAAGNVTTKMVRVYLSDLSGESYDIGSVRFISEKYLDTLGKDSVWRTGEYAKKLAKVLGNRKTNEEYTEVTPMQKVLGIKSVLKPGSGTWDHVQEIWEFSHEEVEKIQSYVENTGVGGDPSDFLRKFGYCRIL